MLALEKNIFDFSKNFDLQVKELRENVSARRNFLSILVLGFMIVMLLVYLFDESYRGRKTIISIFSLACFAFMAFLQYKNHQERTYLNTKNPYVSISQLKKSAFQPESEKRTKELMQSTHDQLSSSKKPFHAQRFGSSYKYDESFGRSLDLGSSTYINQSTEIPSHRKINEQFYEPNSSFYSGYANEGLRDRFPQNQSTSSDRKNQEKTVKDLKVPLSKRNKNEIYEQNQSQLLGYRSGRERAGSMMMMRNDPLRLSTMFTSNSHHPTLVFDPRDKKDGTVVNYKPYRERFENMLFSTLKNVSEEKFNKAIANCKAYIMDNVVTRVCLENIENIEKLNGLIGIFNKRLYEYECILKLQSRGKAESTSLKANYTTILVDDLLRHIDSVKNQGPMWGTSNMVRPETVYETYLKIEEALKKRRYLDQYLKVPGYDLQETRGYITERLINLKEPMSYPGLPSDKRIIANIFFTFLHDIANRNNREEYHFVRRGDNLIYEEKDDGKGIWIIKSYIAKENNDFIFFIENNLSEHEVHYDILSKGEIWAAKPGADNLYSAIVLFAKHFRDNTPTILGIEKTAIFEEFLKGVGSKEF